MNLDYDIELMGSTSAKMSQSIQHDMDRIGDSHGKHFATAVQLNVCVDLMVSVLTKLKSEQDRDMIMLGFLSALATNFKIQVSNDESADLIARAMAKSKGGAA